MITQEHNKEIPENGEEPSFARITSILDEIAKIKVILSTISTWLDTKSLQLNLVGMKIWSLTIQQMRDSTYKSFIIDHNEDTELLGHEDCWTNPLETLNCVNYT